MDLLFPVITGSAVIVLLLLILTIVIVKKKKSQLRYDAEKAAENSEESQKLQCEDKLTGR